MGLPRSKELVEPRYTTSFSIPKDKLYLITWLEMMQERRGVSRSQIIIEALERYFKTSS